MSSNKNTEPSDCAPRHVAEVLAALGKLMQELHEQDLALQNAVSHLASSATSASPQLRQIQHIDVITQTHSDLARFLPELASCLEKTDFDQVRLAEKLHLQSLRDQLLDKSTDNSEVLSGELSLF